ncbi:MAG: endonuclease [Calditrichaeota bacterium]|nr:endonuclease [Calditrichota bacterium]
MGQHARFTRLSLGVLLTLGTASSALADLAWNPTSLNLGTRATDQVHSGSLWLRNTGDEPVLVQDLVSSVPGMALSPASALLAPGDSIQVGWQFQPVQNMPYAGALVASSSGDAAACAMSAAGDWPGTIWDSTYGLTGEALKSQLYTLERVHTELSYDAARALMFGTIDNVGGWVEGVYTGFLVQTSGIPDPNVMNTEHSWPQSMFDGRDSIRTDLHHLFPSKSTINSSRGNLPFGMVVNSSSGFPQFGCDRGTDSNGVTVFEPRDQHKGDVARAMFYASIHYSNPMGFLDYMEPTLRAWSLQDPVSTKESSRNTAIQSAQGNRNPFVDHPELLDRMASISGNANLPSQPALAVWPPAGLDLGAGDSGLLNGHLVLVNSGNTTLHPSGLQVSPTGFSVSGLPASLAPGQSVSLNVIADGAVPGEYSSILSFNTEAGSVALPLQATVGAAVVLPAPVLHIARVSSFISLSWAAVEGAGQYRVERQSPGQAWITVGTSSQPGYAELMPANPSQRLYRVIALP